MADDNKPTLTLLDQQQALTAYLEALFREMPVMPQDEVETTAPPVVNRSAGGNALPLGGRVLTETDLTAKHDEPVELLSGADRQLETAPLPASLPGQTASLPTAPFQVLFFTISGLRLAVPLDRLDGIVKWVDPTPIPKMPGWHLGLVKYQGVTVNVVDVTHIITVPSHLKHEKLSKYQFIVMIGGKRWGIGADAISTVVTLTPEQVKWHNYAESTRPWLAGTVKEQMCALIEVDGLLAMLEARG